MRYDSLKEMTKQELVEAAFDMTGGSVATLSRDDLARKITIASYVFDLCLLEWERRGELEFHQGMPVTPYVCEYAVETVLTRDQPEV